MTYEVIVGNIGTVHTGSNGKDALEAFGEYVKLSRGNYGRAAGESVTLLADEEPIKEYYGTQDKGEEDA